MSSPAETYVQGIHTKFDFYAAWPPNAPRALGDVGRLKDGSFQRLTTLGQLGIKFNQLVGPRGNDLSHSSGESVSVDFKTQGQTLPGISIPEANAGVLVQFSAAGAFVFQATGPTVLEIDNQVELAEQILKKFRTKVKGKRIWQPDWFVITELLTTESVTVLLASSKASKIELSAKGVIPAGPAPLASVDAGLSVVSQKGEVTSLVAAANLTPMFRLSRVRRSVLDRILDGDETADIGRAAAPNGAGGRGAPQRIMELVPVEDALGGPKRSRTPAKPMRKMIGKKKSAKPVVKKKTSRKTVPSKKRPSRRK